MSLEHYEEIDKTESIFDKYEILDNNREINTTTMKPIDEVRIILKGLTKDISSIRSDLAVIKNRLYELQSEASLRQSEASLRQREKNKLQQEQEEKIRNSSKWGFGFY